MPASQREFPAYAELSNPKPLEIGETQALLAADEAMLVYRRRERDLVVDTAARPRRVAPDRYRRQGLGAK
jgi:hypothetical protein